MFAVRSLTECAFADPAKLALDFDPHFRKFHFPDIRDRKESLNHIKRKLRQRKQIDFDDTSQLFVNLHHKSE